MSAILSHLRRTSPPSRTRDNGLFRALFAPIRCRSHSKAFPELSAYCLLDDQSAEAIAPWDLGPTDRKLGADYVVEEDMSFEIGLVDTRDGSEMEEEGYEAILFLDGKQ